MRELLSGHYVRQSTEMVGRLEHLGTVTADLNHYCGFTKSYKKIANRQDVNFTHARNFPFIFNVKLHTCAKIDVEFFLQDFIKPQ